MATTHKTREAWLEAAVKAFRPRFRKAGMPLPAGVHVSVGFGYGAKRESATILGQCWARSVSADGRNHIFISPEMADASRVLDVLIHELIHAADDCKSGHKGAFKTTAEALGLTGKMTSTTATPELATELKALARELGKYPHAALNVHGRPVAPGKPGETPGADPGDPTHSGPKKQGTRLVKVACPCCGYTVRTTAKWLAVGLPSCPAGTVMETEG